MIKKFNEIDWNKHFYYDETSKSCLRFKTGLLKDKEAGSIDLDSRGKNYSRWRVWGDKRLSLAHRVIWFLFHSSCPDDLEIDHINGNPLDNRINNLRLLKREVNVRNNRIRKDNTTGVTGVYKVTENGQIVGYRSCYKHFDRNFKKYFSIAKFGVDGAKQLAIKFREQGINGLNEKGAGYTERHGK